MSAIIAKLREAPREIIVLCLLKLLTSFGYFAMCSVLVLYLSHEHGYSDTEASTLYGMCGFVTSCLGVLCGPLIDQLGIRRSIQTGAIFASVGMLVCALSYDRVPLLVSLLVLIPIGVSIGLPVIDIGGKRYSNPAIERMVFSLLYSSMNVGASLAGIIFDQLRYRAEGRVHIHDQTASSERLLILCGAISICAAGLVAGIALHDTPTLPGAQTSEPWYTVLKKRAFWQLLAFATSLVFVRQIFRNFDTALPKWALRVLGADAPIGSFFAINPTLIVVLAPLCAALLGRFDAYNIQIVGSLFSGLAILLLAGEASVALVVVALILFTFAEAIYSPQTTAFVMAISPEGQEGTFSNLASIPMFASTLLVGLMSGELLQGYCPAPVTSQPDPAAAERRCSTVWLVVGGVALITPLLLLVLRRFIYTTEVQIAVEKRSKRDENDNDA